MNVASFQLEGRRVLVTGGGTGIGRAIAETFVGAGARVVVAGRRRAPLEDVVRKVGGSRACAVPGDVTSPSDRARFLAECDDAFGGLDILVNCAGATSSGSLADLTEAEWRRMFEVNAAAPMLLAREALGRLREKRGSIVGISTGAALRPVPGFGAYGAAKAAMTHASRVLAIEAAPEVRVNVICPGGVDTPIFETFLDAKGADAARRFFDESTPLGRIGQPQDIAAAALYLASDAAQWVTGAVLTVDGGLNSI
jgi:NAD(P)-dependent dehydrogenase (short-subunit alcohol dehydrogenase family)